MKLECIPPVKPTCEETDKGLDFNKFGILKFMTANGTAGTKTDRCNYNNSAVIEMYCKDDGTYGSDEVACDAGMICKEIKDDTGQTIWVGCVKEGECVDTDPQNETNQPGIVYDFKNPPYYDKCLGSTVIECICDPNTKQKNELPPFTCPNGCEGGACK